jgi:hypothetical protein
MQVSIGGESLSAAEGHRSDAGVGHLRAGDLLQARIVEIRPSGKTVFQFDGFRAVAKGPVGGQIGDVWQFEVVPDANEQSDRSQYRQTSANLTQTTTGPRISNAVPQGSITLRLLSLLGKHTVFESSKDTPATLPRTASPGTAISAAPSPLTGPIVQPVQILSTWLQQMRDVVPLSGGIGAKSTLKRSKIPTDTPEKTSPQLIDRSDPTDSKKIDPSAETWNHVLSSGLRLDQRRVKMCLYRRFSDGGDDEASRWLKAVFLLNMGEESGAVRIDIKLGPEVIQVGILVEDEDARRRFAAGLPALTDTLSALTKRCYCRVAIDASKTQEGYEAQPTIIPETMRLDIQV